MATAYDYTNITATAQRLIERFGKQSELFYISSVAQSLIDENKPWLGKSKKSERLPFIGPLFDVEASKIDGTTIQQGDKQVYISAPSLSIPVTEDGCVEDGGVLYNIIPPLQTIAPAGTPIVYIANLRK